MIVICDCGHCCGRGSVSSSSSSSRSRSSQRKRKTLSMMMMMWADRLIPILFHSVDVAVIVIVVSELPYSSQEDIPPHYRYCCDCRLFRTIPLYRFFFFFFFRLQYSDFDFDDSSIR